MVRCVWCFVAICGLSAASMALAGPPRADQAGRFVRYEEPAVEQDEECVAQDEPEEVSGFVTPLSHDEAEEASPILEPLTQAETDETWVSDGGNHYRKNPCCRFDDCGLPRGFWGRVEYTQWWLRGSDLPPLVTTSPANTPQNQAGVLPDATILFGNERVDELGRSGARATLGYWFNDCETCGIESTVFGLSEGGTTFGAISDGTTILGRPFFNVQTQAQDAGLVAFPGIIAGSIVAQTKSQVFGVEVNMRRAFCKHRCVRWDAIAGYRFFRLDEDLHANEQSTSIDPNGQVPLGTTFDINDDFGTRNKFHGGQIGLLMQYHRRRWTYDVGTKLALGGMSQQVAITGSTVTTVPGVAPVTQTGGFLALDSNSGRFIRNRFSLLPELSVNLRYQVTPLWRANVGYNLMYATNVVRPGDQVDLNIDPNQFPPSQGGTQPAFAFHETDVWLQGINVGLECNF